MKRWLILIAALLLLVFGSAAGRSMQNPAISNPMGPATVPPSTIGSGVVDTASPMDNNGNLLITGNVRRGMHFRGDVPYQSPTSFNGNLGTSTLSSFMRDTAGSEDYTRPSYIYGTQPYYSSTETVTSSTPGQSGVLSPASTRINTRVQQDTSTIGSNLFSLESLPRQQTSFSRGETGTEPDSQIPQIQYAPSLSSRSIRTESPSSMDGSVLRDMSLRPWDTSSSTGSQIDTSRQSESQVSNRLGQLNNYEGSTTRDSVQSPVMNRQLEFPAADTSLRYTNQQTGIDTLKLVKPTQPSLDADISSVQTSATRYGLPAAEQFAAPKAFGERASSSITNEGNAKPATLSPHQRDILEQIKQQLNELTRSVDASLDNESATGQDKLPPASVLGEAAKGQKYTPEPRSSSSLYEPQAIEPSLDKEPPAHVSPGAAAVQNNQGANARLQLPAADSYNPPQGSSPLAELNKLSQAELAAEARQIMGQHRSVESFSQARYSQHMLAAEANIRNGRYYDAADFFAMAAIYKPDDPLAVAGRGHALFAAGDYASSALFISRALTISPEYLRTKIDLTAVSGGRDNFVARITEIERWLQRGDSEQLQLLLAYVYYRVGELNRAKLTIDALYQKSPQSMPVRALKAAINGTTTLR